MWWKVQNNEKIYGTTNWFCLATTCREWCLLNCRYGVEADGVGGLWWRTALETNSWTLMTPSVLRLWCKSALSWKRKKKTFVVRSSVKGNASFLFSFLCLGAAVIFRSLKSLQNTSEICILSLSGQQNDSFLPLWLIAESSVNCD